MGKHFGNLQKITGITYYRLSPYELKPLKGVLFPGITNVIRRISENVFYMGFPLFSGYLFMTEGYKYHERLERKNPDAYKNDV